ncbi:MAG: hypothetical protein PVJ27_05650 [Candidatus Brocadiaceae bacterium]|jgi:hypothetical protein
MLPEEKQAVYVLCVFGVAVLAATVLVVLYGWPGIGGLGMGGLAGFGPLIFRGRGKQRMDERDQVIFQKATMVGGVASYLAFVAACMAPWFYSMATGRESILIHYLPLVVVGGMFAYFTARSIVVLVLYRRGVSYGGN